MARTVSVLARRRGGDDATNPHRLFVENAGTPSAELTCQRGIAFTSKSEQIREAGRTCPRPRRRILSPAI